jgi:hypothetical protein
MAGWVDFESRVDSMPALEVNPLHAGHSSGQRVDHFAFRGRLESADDGDDSFAHSLQYA